MNYPTENPDPLAGCPGCGDEITRQEQYTTAVDHNGELFHSNDCVRMWDEEMNGVLAGDDVSLTVVATPLAPTLARLADAIADPQPDCPVCHRTSYWCQGHDRFAVAR